jgi:hypothetical protein
LALDWNKVAVNQAILEQEDCVELRALSGAGHVYYNVTQSGATWSRGRRLLPCCIGKLRKGELPAPFSSFQALNIDEPDDFQRLVGTVVAELGLPKPEPFEAAVVLQKLKEAGQAVVASNPAFIPVEEIQSRLNSGQLSVRLDQGIGQWFVLLVENESSENIEIEEMILETKEGHRLADSAHPKAGEVWKVGPKGRPSVNSQLQPDPCVQILTLHEWPEANFATDVNFRFLCRILDQKKWCERLL